MLWLRLGDRLASIDKEKARVLETNELFEAIQLLINSPGAMKKSTNKLYNTLKDPLQIHDVHLHLFWEYIDIYVSAHFMHILALSS